MTVPSLDLSLHHTPLRNQFKAVFEEVLDCGMFVLGPMVERFEAHLGEYCGTEFAVGMASGTDALLAAIMALEIGPGDEVITTPFTFFATAGCIARVGAKPIFVDIDHLSLNIDPALIESAITKRTRAILPVHLFGLPAKMDRITAIAARHDLKVIEDAAQAIGASHRGQKVGGIGHVGCLSFFPTKNLSALGDAGACVCNDPQLTELLRRVRVHGESTSGGGGEYVHQRIGGNFRMDAIQGGLLNVKLAHLDQWTSARRILAGRYDRQFADTPLKVPPLDEHSQRVYHQYTVLVEHGQRDQLHHHLGQAGIASRIYYPTPLHLQPCFAHFGYGRGQLPVCEQAAGQVLSLPIFAEMTEPQQDEVIGAVRKFFDVA